MQTVSIITYHFVRKFYNTKYPEIKGLPVKDFNEQLNYLSKHYVFVTAEDCINAIYNNGDLPSNPVLLTFDDGYIDHFTEVFPILKKLGIKGVFFPPSKAVQENKVLSVNKIHFILASVKNSKVLLNDIYESLDSNRHLYNLNSNKYYFELLTCNLYGFDNKEITFIKRILQKELDKKLRESIIDKLFKKYVTYDEESFANELYMNISQIEHMIGHGMHIGGHGHEHCWLNTISPKEQEADIDASLVFLKKIGIDSNNWIMCYPYGGYNKSLIEILKKKNCKLAFTVNKGIAKMNKKNALTLERFDTNDLPLTC